MDGLQDKIVRLIAGESVEVDTDDFQNDFETFRSEYQRIFDKHIGEFWDGSWNEGGKFLTFTPLPEN
jgi:hypothetical protein